VSKNKTKEKKNKIYKKKGVKLISSLPANSKSSVRRQALAPNIALFFVFIKGTDNMSSIFYFSEEKKTKMTSNLSP